VFDCTLMVLQLCLFDPRFITIEIAATQPVAGYMVWTLDGRPYHGALGRASVAVMIPLTRTLELRYGYEHQSYLYTTDDRGFESLMLGLTWRPFTR